MGDFVGTYEGKCHQADFLIIIGAHNNALKMPQRLLLRRSLKPLVTEYQMLYVDVNIAQIYYIVSVQNGDLKFNFSNSLIFSAEFVGTYERTFRSERYSKIYDALQPINMKPEISTDIQLMSICQSPARQQKQ